MIVYDNNVHVACMYSIEINQFFVEYFYLFYFNKQCTSIQYYMEPL